MTAGWLTLSGMSSVGPVSYDHLSEMFNAIDTSRAWFVALVDITTSTPRAMQLRPVDNRVFAIPL